MQRIRLIGLNHIPGGSPGEDPHCQQSHPWHEIPVHDSRMPCTTSTYSHPGTDSGRPGSKDRMQKQLDSTAVSTRMKMYYVGGLGGRERRRTHRDTWL